MQYSISTFNKELHSLEYSNVEDFFKTSKDENLNLEFKSFVAQGVYSQKEDAIKKAVCAMLNSEGGIIIWGAPIETRDGNGNTSAVGALTPFLSQIDRDRFVNIISSSIIPMPIGIKVQVVKNPEQESIFIIEVEKSIDKPHQFDNRYYIRLDGQTRIAPHYLISALMKGTTFPVIRGHLRLKAVRTHLNSVLLDFRYVLFNTSPYINEVNIGIRIVATPGRLIIAGNDSGSMFHERYPLLSHGSPMTSDFSLIIPTGSMNDEINILFQFGGEKSPSKMSKYTYRFPQIPIGDVADESIYLVKKSENVLPESSAQSANENIEDMLNY